MNFERSRSMTTSPVNDGRSEAVTTVEVEALDDTLIEDVSIDGMCGVY
jgi:mycofactocin precursor